MTEQERFAHLLGVYGECAERLLYYKINSRTDAQDVIQETFLAAMLSFHSLQDETRFKPWLLEIARHKLNDYYRCRMNTPLWVEDTEPYASGEVIFANSLSMSVEDALEELCEKDRQLLQMVYWQGYNQQELARQLGIPLGTLKSRLYTARQNFKRVYENAKVTKGETAMQTMQAMPALPKTMPKFIITRIGDVMEPIDCREMGSYAFLPELHEEARRGYYEAASGKLSEESHAVAEGRASIHGEEGVSFFVRQWIQGDRQKEIRRWLVCQDKGEQVRFLSEAHYVWGEGERPDPTNPADYKRAFSQIYKTGIKVQRTFLDEGFFKSWGTDSENSGIETRHLPAETIAATDDGYCCDGEKATGLVGRYRVKIGSKTHITACLVECHTNRDFGTALSERYIDENGRTVLARQYAAKLILRVHDKAFAGAPRPQMIVNGETLYNTYQIITGYSV